MAKKPKPKHIRIQELLALNNTAGARKLLQKHGKEDAKDYVDLEYKLTQLYKEQDDKKAFEKELAEIHPHKNFILKYLAPSITETAIPLVTAEKQEVVVEPIQSKHGNLTIVDSGYSNADGEHGCSCASCNQKRKYSNACGCSGSYSNFSGSDNKNSNSLQLQHNQIMILAIFGTMALFGYLIYKEKRFVKI